jgi:hypothetical protein
MAANACCASFHSRLTRRNYIPSKIFLPRQKLSITTIITMHIVRVVGLAFAVTSIAAIAIPEADFGPLLDDSSIYSTSNITGVDELPLDWPNPAIAADRNGQLWDKAAERGAKLLLGMKSSDAEAAMSYNTGDTIESPFDGDGVAAFRQWGYNDNPIEFQKEVNKECDMDSINGHKLKQALTDLGLDTRSKNQGGANECFSVEHYDGPAVKRDDKGQMPSQSKQRYDVCGREYRITGAEHTIGVNAAGGAVFAIGIMSAARSARRVWGVDPKADELPHIRTVSDIAWAFWNRAAAGNIQDIKYFFVTMIINPETNRHIRRALKTLNPPKEEVDGWPGVDFDMESVAGQALLGSPVGRWAGYFLVQHKRQLGGNKHVSKVRVFKSEKPGSLPYLLFYVKGPDPEPTPSGVSGGGKPSE